MKMRLIKLNFVVCILAVFISQCLSVKECGYGLYYDGYSCVDCGITAVEPNVRIVGGVDAVKGSWPAQVLVAKYFSLFGLKFLSGFCGGTLISRYTVLSAAHCVGNSPYDVYVVYAGAYNISTILNDETIDPEISVHPVRKVIPHPSYSESNLLNDIALFLLYDRVYTSDTINVACLPRKSSSYPEYNNTVYLAGWGLTTEDGSESSILKNVNITVYDQSYCSNVVPEVIKNWDTQICAGEYSGGKDTCQGDSGGGLMVADTSSWNTKYVVGGIVSYGVGCARPESPGIYTRTSYYIDWIKQYWQTEELPTTPAVPTTTTRSSYPTDTTSRIIFTDQPSSTTSTFTSSYSIFALIFLSFNIILISF